MKRNFRLNNSERNQPLPVLPLMNEQNRLDWIKQQADQVVAQAVEEFRQRLAEAKQQSEKGSASQQLDQEG